jgi:hypothetical protein
VRTMRTQNADARGPGELEKVLRAGDTPVGHISTDGRTPASRQGERSRRNADELCRIAESQISLNQSQAPSDGRDVSPLI